MQTMQTEPRHEDEREVPGPQAWRHTRLAREAVADRVLGGTPLVFLLDAESRVVDVNASTAELLGYRPDELAGRLVTELMRAPSFSLAAPSAPEVRTFLRRGGGVVSLEVRVEVMEGGHRIVTGRCLGTPELDGEFERFERRVSEEQQALVERLLLTFDGIPISCVVCDASLRVTYENPAAERLFGFPLEEVAGRQPQEAFATVDDRDALATLLTRVSSAENTAHGVVESVSRSGRRLVCDWHITALKRPDGTFVGVLCLCEDVTERRRAEEALFESQRALATLLSNLPGVAYRCRPQEGVLLMEFVSCRVLDLTGYPPEAFLAEPRLLFGELIDPADQERVAREVSLALERRTPFAVQYRIRTRSGEERWVWDQGGGVFSPTGELLAVEGYINDITEQRRLEEALRQSQKLEAVGRLAGGVAHDFNNLLTVVLGSAVLALERLPEDAAARGEIGLVLDAAQRAGALTHQLLAFARKQVVKPRVIEVGALLTGLGGILKRLLGDEIAFVRRVADRLWAVRVDPGQLEQVLVNLVVNARAAMPRGGTLTLEARNVALKAGETRGRPDVEPGEYVTLTVRDTGVGMERETLAHIFEPFYTTKGPGRGTGLGLASSYGIVRQAGGHIRVESEPGQGSAFTILLPRCAALPEPPRPATSTATRGGETVLLVEDAPFVMRVATLALERKGYSVLTAATGDDALRVAVAHEGAIDLLVTDMVMPGMSGTELSVALRAVRPNIGVLYVSGYTEDNVVTCAPSRFGGAFLPKPFTPEGLAQKVRAVLDGEKDAFDASR